MGNPTQTVNRQANEMALLRELYSRWPVGEEQKEVNVNEISSKLEMTYERLNSAVRSLEAVGILSRRISWGSKGKVSNWTLLTTQEDAEAYLNNAHNAQLKTFESKSLKQRVLEAVISKGPFNSPKEIADAIRTPDEQINIRGITRVLGSLKDEGKITFKRDTNGKHHPGKASHSMNNNVPYDIAVQPKGMSKDMTNFRNHPNVAIGGPIERELPIVPAPTITEPPTEEFPLIYKLVKRREFLLEAARLADEGGESEIALELMERAEKETGPLHIEVIALYNAYHNCKDGN